MTIFEVLQQIKNKVAAAAGFETLSPKAVAADTTLLHSDARTVATDTTAGVVTLTLPASPYDGMEFRIYDAAAAGSWSTNTLTVSGNGKNIVLPGAAAGATASLTTRSGTAVLRYDSTSTLWHALAKT